MIDTLLIAMAIGRMILGLAPFVAAGLSARLLGFPPAHDNPTSRLMARWFGVRDIGLGVLVLYALQHREILSFVLLFNALTDGGDLVAMAIPLFRRQGIDRGVIASAAFALPAGVAWLLLRAAVAQ